MVRRRLRIECAAVMPRPSVRREPDAHEPLLRPFVCSPGIFTPDFHARMTYVDAPGYCAGSAQPAAHLSPPLRGAWLPPDGGRDCDRTHSRNPLADRARALC